MKTENLHILIIEDNEGDWFLVKEFLSELYNENYILQSSSIKEASSLLSQNKFDAILMDFSLPDSIGTKGIEKIISLAQNAPVIILTSHNEKSLAIQSLKLGVQDYLLKDELTVALLLKTIAFSIERNKVRLQLINEQNKRELIISNAVIEALEKERSLISSELHDNISQLLATTSMFMQLAKKNKEKYEHLLDESLIILNNATSEIRSVSHSLAPPKLNHETLEEALNYLITVTRKSSGISILLQCASADLKTLSEKLSLNIFRIVQEQLNNIIKHARASEVLIKLQKKDDSISMEIVDNGIGIDQMKKSEGIGITNIKTRVKIFNGKAELISAPMKGCKLFVEMNLN